jgi:hypothetical protein
MANIKLFGNTKIQGKTLFTLSEPEPTYSIEKSVSSVDEGASVTFTLTTTNVANGTEVPYTITGISAADITSGSLTGNFTVNNNTATVTITATADQLTEGAETATLTLDNVADFDSVTVNDTSLTPFSPDQITGLMGWYDATEGVYGTNGNDFVDSTASFTIAFAYLEGLGNFSTGMTMTPNTINSKPEYTYVTSNYGITTYGTIAWNGSAWCLTYHTDADVDPDTGDIITPSYDGQITATGNTDYAWQANWGSGNSATRTATVSSNAASINGTITKWRNKAKALSNPYGGHFSQGNLSLQPKLKVTDDNKKYIEFTSDSLYASTANSSAQRTYYMVAFNQSSYAPVLASGSSSSAGVRRGALIYGGTNQYGLSQGGTAAQQKYSNIQVFTEQHIVCASFNSSGTGKISVNNSSEQNITGLGTNFIASPSFYAGTSSGTGMYVNIKEILFFEGAHTTEQKTQVINYLNAKYNLF